MPTWAASIRADCTQLTKVRSEKWREQKEQRVYEETYDSRSRLRYRRHFRRHLPLCNLRRGKSRNYKLDKCTDALINALHTNAPPTAAPATTASPKWRNITHASWARCVDNYWNQRYHNFVLFLRLWAGSMSVAGGFVLDARVSHVWSRRNYPPNRMAMKSPTVVSRH